MHWACPRSASTQQAVATYSHQLAVATYIRHRIFVEHSTRIGRRGKMTSIQYQYKVCCVTPRLLAQFPTFAATLSDVGVCIANLTSPNVPSPIVLPSTNCPTCTSLPLGIGNVGGKLPGHLRRFAMALSPRADPLRLGAG